MLGTGFIRLSKELFTKQQSGPRLPHGDKQLRSLCLKLGIIQVILVACVLVFFSDNTDFIISSALAATANVICYWGLAWLSFDVPRAARYILIVAGLCSIGVSAYISSFSAAFLPAAAVGAVYSLSVIFVAARQLTGGSVRGIT